MYVRVHVYAQDNTQMYIYVHIYAHELVRTSICFIVESVK